MHPAGSSRPSRYGERRDRNFDKPGGTRQRNAQPVACAVADTDRATRLPKPDYELVEELLRDALDDLRNATIMMTKGEMGTPVAESLAEAASCLRELDDLFDHDPLAAHAAGRIFTQLLLERVEAMMSLSRAASGTELAPEHVAALTRMPDLVRKRRRKTK